jgi:outer membrane protein assembly factor BamB
MKLLLPATALLASATLAAADPSWPQFRGPAANPISSHPALPTHWSKTQNIEWATPIPGRGWSSPIVAGNKIFLTSVTTDGASKKPQVGTEYSNEYAAELSKQGLSFPEILAKINERDFEMPSEVQLHYFLHCLDLNSGALLWKQEFYSGRPPGGRHRKNSFTSETPVTDGKSVYVYVANLGLYAFSLKGKPQWSTPLEPNPIYLEFGTGGSPALHGNQLLILSDNQKQQFLASYDKRNGKQLWRTLRDLGDKPPATDSGNAPPVPRSAWTTPFVWTTPLRTEIVTIGPNQAISYDLEGKEVWRLSGMSAAPVPSPFAAGGLLFLNGGRGKPLFAVKPGATGDITPPRGERSSTFVAWSDQRGGTYLPTPVVLDGGVYSLNETGILTRFNAATGQVSYKTRLDPSGAAGYFTTSPWAYNGQVFCLSEEGQTYVVTAGEKFALHHINALDEMAMATPALIGDRLLVRTDSRLYSIRQPQPGGKPAAAQKNPTAKTP